ncbi:MAG: hypothetical protein ACI8YQ_003970 [Polaribacter sp.]|jgi:hypothetical protein
MLFALYRCGYNVKDGVVLYTYWHEGMGNTVKTTQVSNVDPKSFKKIKSERAYGVDKFHAFYEGKIIEHSLGNSFIALKGGFSKDAKSVFYSYQKIKGANSKTFKLINNGPFSYDKNNIYYDWKPIGATDINSFEVINSLGAKDNQYYYKVSNAGDDSLHISKYPIKDKKSFQHLKHRYSKDDFQIYFDGEVVVGADSRTFEVIDYGKGKDSNFHYYGKSIINSPQTFKELSKGYSIDSLSVYYKWSLIKDAKPEGFVILNQFWSKDNSYIYLEGEKTELIEFNTFSLIKGKYVKDKNSVFYLSSIINEVDSKTTESVDSWNWIRDKNSYFFKGEKVKDIDYASFQILKNDYSKDKNRVYFRLEPLNEIDVQSFQTTNGTYGGRDKSGEYYKGENLNKNSDRK